MGLKIKLIFGFLLVSFNLNAQLLWKATSKKGSVCYLFGTMHMGAGNFVGEHPRISEIISECNLVYTEVDLSRTQLAGKLADHMFLPEGMKISDSLTADEIKKLDSFLGLFGSPLINAKSLDRCRPMYIQVIFTALMFKGDTANRDTSVSVDQQVTRIAKAQNKELRYLETQDEQLKYLLDDPDLALQFKLLRKSLSSDKSEDSTKLMYLKLPDIYRSQNLESLQEVLNASSAGGASEAALMESLLTERNRRWVSKIIETGKKKKDVALYAVGAGHLPGSGGLIELLRAEGYTVEPVKID